MKKTSILTSLLIVVIMCIPTTANASTISSASINTDNLEIESNLNEEKGLLGEYIEYTDVNGNVIVEEYTEELQKQMNKARNAYRETVTYKVYDNGITSHWSYLSNPYHIVTIAKGMTYERSRTITTSITGTISSSLSSESAMKKAVAKAFQMNTSFSKSLTEKVTLSGPSGKASSRSFYYKQGRHTHSVKVVRTVTGNQGMGVLSKKTYTGSVGVPALYTYSVDNK